MRRTLTGRARSVVEKLHNVSLLARFAAASLVVFLVLGVAIAYFLQRSIQDNALAATRTTAYDTFHSRLLDQFKPGYLTAPMSGQTYRRFDQFIKSGVLSKRTVRVRVWDSHGRIIYSSDPLLMGKRFPVEGALVGALHGSLSSDISSLSDAENRDDKAFGQLLEVYLPIQFKGTGTVSGAFELYQAYQPVANEIATQQHQVYLLLGGGLFLLYILLFGIVRTGSNTISEQQRQLRGYTNSLEASYDQTILSLAAAVDARDSSTELHAERVTELAVALGQWIKLSDNELRDLQRGALLHDVGKIGISDRILLKPEPLTDEEWKEMRRHPEIGCRMLRGIAFLERALPIVQYHHERWDGTGYPEGLKGNQIPLQARLFAIIDAYDAITSNRPYRAAASHEVALQRLQQDAGTQFDPSMVAAFEAMMLRRLHSPFSAASKRPLSVPVTLSGEAH